jgi:hypothetical protein
LGNISGQRSVCARTVIFSILRSPLTLNPALTVNLTAIWCGGNYRNQWPDVNCLYHFHCVCRSAHFAGVLPKTTDGGGIMAMTDKTANGILNSNYFALSTAFTKLWMKMVCIKSAWGFRARLPIKRLMDPGFTSDGLQIDGTGFHLQQNQ